MKLIPTGDRQFLSAISGLVFANPFLRDRIEFERLALGSEFTVEPSGVWNKTVALDTERPNVVALSAKTETVANKLRTRLQAGADASTDELSQYQNLIQYLLYYRYWDAIDVLITTAELRKKTLKWWAKFEADFRHYLQLEGRCFPIEISPQHMLACFFQIRRAFHHIFDFVVGGSAPAAQLRASIWQSVFTHDMQRYQRSLFEKMADIPTMITGPSGTGKELVARAIGLSRYVPFEPNTKKFATDYSSSFHPVHLASMTEGLIESELFGHRKGSFTGAEVDRTGRLESCTECGTVFLDEIGEVSTAIQVKLLRVLQSREFFRVGESEPRTFAGKVISATNRNLAAEIMSGDFREDLYFRLCADTIVTPSLREQLDDCPEDLSNLVHFIATRVAGAEAASVADEAITWLEGNCPADYAWNGNIRELEQCVRNIMVHGTYQAPKPPAKNPSAAESMLGKIESAALTADELLQHYCDVVYSKTNNYEQAARLLNLDRRTVKSKVDAFRANGNKTT